jgi:hypothetical protein
VETRAFETADQAAGSAAAMLADGEPLSRVWRYVFAARAEIDADDIILLYRQLGFTTVNEGLDLVEQAYPGRPIPAKVRFLPTEIVDSMQN